MSLSTDRPLAPVTSFSWPPVDGAPAPLIPSGDTTTRSLPWILDAAEPPPEPSVEERIAAAAAEARAEGFAAGEQAAAAAAEAQVQANLQRVESTLAELATLHARLVRETERDMVRLAIAIGARLARREIQADPVHLLGIVRSAVARLGNGVAAAVHLHPSEHALVAAALDAAGGDRAITLVADPTVQPGGCLVESAVGRIEASIDAQVQEIVAALFDDEPPPAETAQAESD